MDLFRVLTDASPLLLKGLRMTVGITVMSLVLAMILGVFTCLFAISERKALRPLRWLAAFYVWFIRGTPMLVQAMYIFFALPQLLRLITGANVQISVFTASLVTLTMNAGAYLSEIFRGAINAVNKGQMEASRSLGLSYGQSMTKVILPQAVRICLPSLVNQCIITLKDSTILYAIGLSEIMYYGKIYVGRTFESLATYTWIAIFFLAVVSLLSFISKRIERRLSL
ncbi:MAG: amino acid ABC transporter permease [Firmicutes bacterium]|nr:amino acid ABC transporter permease [Bacillota bacterium]